MSNFPYHRPAEWELYRTENVHEKRRRERTEESKALADQHRKCPEGNSWAEQRWVNQVVPAEMVNADNFDTFKYRYQIYARPPPTQCEPRSLAEVTDEPPPLQYNVKRVAVDRPCGPQRWDCARHWQPKPWPVNNVNNQPCQNSPVMRGDCTQNNSNMVPASNGDLPRNSKQSCATSVSVQQSSSNLTTNTDVNNEKVDKLPKVSSCNNNNSNESQKEKPAPGYGTYKIIGGRQYHEPPDPYTWGKTKLPSALEEYREFTRRCPNHKIGRYDRNDPANELLLPSNKSAITIATSRSPFMFCRNPKAGKLPPLLQAPTQEESLDWPLSS